ncbi:TPA: AlwI family type II restriction endonuclease [Clostridioides difficile]|nr:AlwI family type II restriction endonuclease [Clostridioides difficile]HCQ6315742.1 AlwI family type II restriction endonuclease [Clostridioides difficile]
MPDHIAYVSFMWSLGTTSFRTKEFNRKIEEQLRLLKEFWSKPENTNVAWDRSYAVEGQTDIISIKNDYYDFMRDNGFVEGNDSVKYKAAREKTTGLVSLGLINDNRRLTDVGQKLLRISRTGNYESDNFLNLPKDSFLYLKQLLKTSIEVNGNTIRPFYVLLHLVSKLDYLSYDEFTYLAPLCINDETVHYIETEIRRLRRNETDIDSIIWHVIINQQNYVEALQLFLGNQVDEDLICKIGMNRKSGTRGSKKYDKEYYPLYESLKAVCLDGDFSKLYDAYQDTQKIKIGTSIRAYLFNTTSKVKIQRDPQSTITDKSIYSVNTEDDFKTEFFKMMHLSKARATLHDYFDLNRRYIKISDAFLFEDDKVTLDVLPGIFFREKIDEIYGDMAYSSSDNLQLDCELEEIHPLLTKDEAYIIDQVEVIFGVKVNNLDDVKKIVESRKLERFNALIDRKFSNDTLIRLLGYFRDRRDEDIQQIVSDSADVPTIFEYILGIIWYKVSERRGNILKYMHLSFDADLLPKSHAGGGESDIEYEYEATADYPAHTLLLEATLMNPSAQKLNEDEPATRHLGETRLLSGNDYTYCLFAAPDIPLNLISSFRNKKTLKYYNKDYSSYVTNLKLIPIETEELKLLLEKNVTYDRLYGIFDTAYDTEEDIPFWYEFCIKEKLEAI